MATEHNTQPPWDLRLLTPEEVCELWGVKLSWLYDQVEAGRIRPTRLGRQLRFREIDLAAYLNEREAAA
jgi:excisionase family DNA binding protein